MIDNGPYVADMAQYDELVREVYQNHPPITLPPEYAGFIEKNMIQFLIRLSRYKFASKMIKPEDHVLEIGCGSGLGAIFLSQYCKSVTGLEVKNHEIDEANSINRRKNVVFVAQDFFTYAPDNAVDVIVSLDVIEHMKDDTGRQFIQKTTGHLKQNGMLIIGSPSIYSYEFQSDLSKAAHVKLYGQKELSDMIGAYYGRTLAFSMNDETIHTGFEKLAWYNFVLAFNPIK